MFDLGAMLHLAGQEQQHSSPISNSLEPSQPHSAVRHRTVVIWLSPS
jgi:hypothetical protein